MEVIEQHRSKGRRQSHDTRQFTHEFGTLNTTLIPDHYFLLQLIGLIVYHSNIWLGLLFDLILYVPVNNFTVILGRVFLC